MTQRIPSPGNSYFWRTAACNTGLPTDQPRRKWFDGVVVRCALEDHEGNLWLGTAHSGLWRLRPRAVFWTVAVPAKLKNVAVMIRAALVEDHAGYGGTVAGLLDTTSDLTCVAACPARVPPLRIAR